jgi:P2 family phage contractile tail tube protein
MATTRKKISNANVYVNGASLLGKVSEATMPDITIKQIDHAPLGQHGVTSLPVGFDKMEMTLKWTSFYNDVIASMADGYNSISGQLRSSQETYDAGGGRSAEESFVYFFRGRPTNLPTGSFKQHENAEGETKVALDYIKLEIAGSTQFEIDVVNNVYIVNGVDKLATYRANLGI